ncbi:RNA helicase [Marinobacterium nitratireducens]|uniref:RNA helicase n=1 Tax=Marinobacterium nitratireducens TaxID=518897 RepID=A0A918DPH4_9GAMM|nr:DEAD/DEAH box helicase [Marinobacterium nitratireducens]GGO75622.1 RNA helicase [Marinobacterium nitratireducens]
MHFSDLSLDTRLLKLLERLNFVEPTEIQRQAIPFAIAGRDLIASSKTGSGKTLAFLLPALQRVMRQKALSKRDPRVLVLVPTRELAGQVYGQLRALLAGTSFKCALVLGGENFNDQEKLLRRDPHFVVATPGRLANHLEGRSLGLDGLEMLVLDEADRMLDLGFAEQLRQINAAASHRLRQTLMFSATLDHAETEALAADLLKDPKRIAVDAVTRPHEDIRQRFLLSDNLDHKQAQLERLLSVERYQQAIVFTATRGDTDRLADWLSQRGLKTVALSGERSQAERNRIMDGFSRGQQQVLVTTDVASRGLDLLNVSLVINFDLPKHSEEYVHRIGRTGRAGAKGDAVSLVGPKDWDSLTRIRKLLAHSIEFDVLDGLEARFKGLRPKPVDAPRGPRPVKKRPAPNANAARARDTAAPARRRRAPSTVVSSDGLAPMKKRKPAAED